jgi:KDO2-lipid IV(A) lauroyltransferase
MPKEFYKPKYWSYWCIIGALKLFVLLPYKVQLKIGKKLGALGYKYAKKRRKVTEQNLTACFPEKSSSEINTLCLKSFESVGVAAIESIIAWFMSKRRFKRIPFKINFEYDLINTLEPTLLLGSHFTSMEIVGRYMASNYKNFNVVYQKHKNPFMEWLITSSREKYTKCLQRKNVLAIIRALKNNEKVWYAPDQDFGNERTIFAHFFGIKCTTLTATPWIANKTNAKVIPCYYIRNDNLDGYQLFNFKAWKNFPIGDEYADAMKYNDFLENIIRKHPEQYLWQHRRFKTRPKDDPESIYS